MSELPRLPLEMQQKLTADELRQLPCVELIDENKEFIGFLIIPSSLGGMTIWDEIKNHAESLGVRSNIVVPLQVIRALNETIENKPVERYPNLAKARAVRQINLALRHANRAKREELVRV